jgi:hypothetical protein
MKSRSAAWAGILVLCFAASSCNTRSTPASTSQPQPTAETASQSSPAPAPTEERTPAEPKAAAKEKKTLPSEKTESQMAQKAPPTPLPPPPPVILPAGTVLSVRINEAVGSKTSKAGDKFTASIVEPVMLQGQSVIPARSAAEGIVDQAQQGGKIKGSSSLSLRLTSVNVKGVAYPIRTGSFLEQGKGKGSRTAKSGAVGAGAGALVGGLAGGGKGALIGSAVGGGAGVAGSAFTGNKELTIPAETVLQFKLAQPLRLSTENNPNKQPASNPNQQ